MSGHTKAFLQALFDRASSTLRGFIDPLGNELGAVPYLLAQTGVPVILPSSGSSDAVGTITFTTALPYTPANGQPLAVYLPAGVVTAGSQGTGAGVYQATGKGTNNSVSLTGTGIVTANGAYTQTTASNLTLANVTIPGGAMGPNGRLRTMVHTECPNNVNAKATVATFGGATVLNQSNSTIVQYLAVITTVNRGVQNAQIGYSTSGTAGGSGTSSAASVVTTVDTSQAQVLTLSGQLAVATDYLILNSYSVEVMPAA